MEIPTAISAHVIGLLIFKHRLKYLGQLLPKHGRALKKHQRCNAISRKESLRISEQHRDAPAINPTSTRPFGHPSDLLAEPNSTTEENYRTETLGECMCLCTYMHHTYV